MSKNLIFILSCISFSCLSPEEIDYSADQEIIALDELLSQSIMNQPGYQLTKEVVLDGSKEVEIMTYDPQVLQKDLKSTSGFTYSRLIMSANYNKNKTENGWTYTRKVGENKGPDYLLIEKEMDLISYVEIGYTERNFLYFSDQTIKLFYDGNRLTEYNISGQRNLIGMDRSIYLIKTSISKN